ncbi:MAG: hypothetical protein JKY22_11215 [Flavobacteriaceae bacterium]|nr:hypothetical protein [Flavobacteriaceae bacterium]
MKNNKYKLLRKGIIYDIVGMTTMFIPLVGPFLDILWAPYAAKKMRDMYEGNTGKIASWIVFVEEILPFTDFVPTFTLMWIYTFVFSSEKTGQMQTIEVEVNE